MRSTTDSHSLHTSTRAEHIERKGESPLQRVTIKPRWEQRLWLLLPRLQQQEQQKLFLNLLSLRE